MKKLLPFVVIAMLLACNNSKKENKKETGTETNRTDNDQTVSPTPGSTNTRVTIDGKEIALNGSLLVTKDKEALQPGAPYFCMLTASSSSSDETLSLNFMLDTKPGIYPVVGLGMSRGSGDKGEVYGGLAGGQPKITQYKVNITEVKDLGDNGIGGHKWSVSGTFEEMITIPAMGVMLMDKSRNHPESIKIEKASFSDLTFDDNWEELIEKAMDRNK